VENRTGFLSVSLSIAVVMALSMSGPAGAQGGPNPKAKAAPARDSKSASPIDRGRYLVTIGQCNDCHTPWKMGPAGPVPDLERMLMGHPAELKLPPPPKLTEQWNWAGAVTFTAFTGPWGISYSANLTPDDSTGIGKWTYEQFLTTLKTGTHIDGKRPILPPMPWPNVAQMTDEDLKAVFAYLKSIPPIKNAVPAAVIAQAPPKPKAK
jgi:mono/diheme cytochrome c family protein